MKRSGELLFDGAGDVASNQKLAKKSAAQRAFDAVCATGALQQPGAPAALTPQVPVIATNPMNELNELLQANHLLPVFSTESITPGGFVSTIEATPELAQRVIVSQKYTSPPHAKKTEARKAAATMMLNALHAAIELEESSESRLPLADVPAYAQLPAIGVPTKLGVKVERADSVLYIKRYAGPVPHESVTDVKVQCPLSKDRASAMKRGLRALEQQALSNCEILSASQLGAFHPSAAVGAATALGQLPFFENGHNVVLGLEEDSVNDFVHKLSVKLA